MTDYLPLFQRLPKYFERRKSDVLAGDKAISFEAYADIPAANASLLKNPTAAHMLHYLLEGHKETEAMQLGTLVHSAILEPETFPSTYVVLPDNAPTRPSLRQINAKKPSSETLDAIAFWSSFNDTAVGKKIVDAVLLDKVEQIRDAVFAHHFARQIITAPGQNEATVTTWDDEHGVNIKARYDRLPGASANFLLDIKTTSRGLSPYEIVSEVRKRAYGLQAAFYFRALELACNDRRNLFYFIFVRTEPPYLARVFELNEGMPSPNLLHEASQYITGDGTTQPGRLPMFCSASLEFLRLVQEGHQNPISAFSGYEHEQAQLLIP